MDTLIYFIFYLTGVLLNIALLLCYMKLYVIYTKLPPNLEFAYYDKTTHKHINFLSILPYLYSIFLVILCVNLGIGYIIKCICLKMRSEVTNDEPVNRKQIKGFSNDNK